MNLFKSRITLFCFALCASISHADQSVVITGTPAQNVFVAVAPNSQNLSVGQKIQAGTVIAGAGQFTPAALTWSSSNTDVATVDESGTVTAVSPGSATIIGTDKRGISRELVVVVYAN